MKVSNNIIIHAEAGDELSDLKQKMFQIKELTSKTTYGIFNGEFYICYPYYRTKDNIEKY